MISCMLAGVMSGEPGHIQLHFTHLQMLLLGMQAAHSGLRLPGDVPDHRLHQVGGVYTPCCTAICGHGRLMCLRAKIKVAIIRK